MSGLGRIEVGRINSNLSVTLTDPTASNALNSQSNSIIFVTSSTSFNGQSSVITAYHPNTQDSLYSNILFNLHDGTTLRPAMIVDPFKLILNGNIEMTNSGTIGSATASTITLVNTAGNQLQINSSGVVVLGANNANKFTIQNSTPTAIFTANTVTNSIIISGPSSLDKFRVNTSVGTMMFGVDTSTNIITFGPPSSATTYRFNSTSLTAGGFLSIDGSRNLVTGGSVNTDIVTSSQFISSADSPGVVRNAAMFENTSVTAGSGVSITLRSVDALGALSSTLISQTSAGVSMNNQLEITRNVVGSYTALTLRNTNASGSVVALFSVNNGAILRTITASSFNFSFDSSIYAPSVSTVSLNVTLNATANQFAGKFVRETSEEGGYLEAAKFTNSSTTLPSTSSVGITFGSPQTSGGPATGIFSFNGDRGFAFDKSLEVVLPTIPNTVNVLTLSTPGVANNLPINFNRNGVSRTLTFRTDNNFEFNSGLIVTSLTSSGAISATSYSTAGALTASTTSAIDYIPLLLHNQTVNPGGITSTSISFRSQVSGGTITTGILKYENNVFIFDRTINVPSIAISGNATASDIIVSGSISCTSFTTGGVSNGVPLNVATFRNTSTGVGSNVFITFTSATTVGGASVSGTLTHTGAGFAFNRDLTVPNLTVTSTFTIPSINTAGSITTSAGFVYNSAGSGTILNAATLENTSTTAGSGVSITLRSVDSQGALTNGVITHSAAGFLMNRALTIDQNVNGTLTALTLRNPNNSGTISLVFQNNSYTRNFLLDLSGNLNYSGNFRPTSLEVVTSLSASSITTFGFTSQSSTSATVNVATFSNTLSNNNTAVTLTFDARSPAGVPISNTLLYNNNGFTFNAALWTASAVDGNLHLLYVENTSTASNSNSAIRFRSSNNSGGSNTRLLTLVTSVFTFDDKITSTRSASATTFNALELRNSSSNGSSNVSMTFVAQNGASTGDVTLDANGFIFSRRVTSSFGFNYANSVADTVLLPVTLTNSGSGSAAVGISFTTSSVVSSLTHTTGGFVFDREVAISAGRNAAVYQGLTVTNTFLSSNSQAAIGMSCTNAGNLALQTGLITYSVNGFAFDRNVSFTNISASGTASITGAITSASLTTTGAISGLTVTAAGAGSGITRNAATFSNSSTTANSRVSITFTSANTAGNGSVSGLLTHNDVGFVMDRPLTVTNFTASGSTNLADLTTSAGILSFTTISTVGTSAGVNRNAATFTNLSNNSGSTISITFTSSVTGGGSTTSGTITHTGAGFVLSRPLTTSDVIATNITTTNISASSITNSGTSASGADRVAASFTNTNTGNLSSVSLSFTSANLGGGALSTDKIMFRSGRFIMTEISTTNLTVDDTIFIKNLVSIFKDVSGTATLMSLSNLTLNQSVQILFRTQTSVGVNNDGYLQYFPNYFNFTRPVVITNDVVGSAVLTSINNMFTLTNVNTTAGRRTAIKFDLGVTTTPGTYQTGSIGLKDSGDPADLSVGLYINRALVPFDATSTITIGTSAIGFPIVYSPNHRYGLRSELLFTDEYSYYRHNYQSTAVSGFRSSGINLAGTTTVSAIGFLLSSSNGTLPADEFQMFPGSLVPAVTNAKDLGTSVLRYRNIFLVNAPNVSSDRRLKQNITTTELGLEFIMDLNPVRYQTVESAGGRYHHGLIAQEVKETLDKHKIDTHYFAGFVHDTGKKTIIRQIGTTQPEEVDVDIMSLRYTEFIAPMIKAIQELKAEVDHLRSLISAQ